MFFRGDHADYSELISREKSVVDPSAYPSSVLVSEAFAANVRMPGTRVEVTFEPHLAIGPDSGSEGLRHGRRRQ